MRLLFATDHVFQIGPEGAAYTQGGKYPYELWRRSYLCAFEDLTVVGRGAHAVGDLSRLSPSFGPGVRHRLLGRRRGAARLTELPAHRRAIAEEVQRADVVIARLPGELGLMAAAAARRMNKPCLVEVVASARDGMRHRGGAVGRVYAPILEQRVRRAVARAPLAVYVTDRFLQDAYPRTGAAWAVSDVMLSPASDATIDARLRRLEAGSPLTLATIGALHTRMKGIHIALRALAQVRDRLPPFVYRVLGEGDADPYRREAERLGLADRVAFDGVLPGGEAVSRWLDDIDLYLQPSFQEGLPRALIEALSRGCLACASTAGGSPELLGPHRLHPPGDADALAELILDVVAAPVEARRSEVRANLTTAGRYLPEALAARRREAFDALRAQAEAAR